MLVHVKVRGRGLKELPHIRLYLSYPIQTMMVDFNTWQAVLWEWSRTRHIKLDLSIFSIPKNIEDITLISDPVPRDTVQSEEVDNPCNS